MTYIPFNYIFSHLTNALLPKYNLGHWYVGFSSWNIARVGTYISLPKVSFTDSNVRIWKGLTKRSSIFHLYFFALTSTRSRWEWSWTPDLSSWKLAGCWKLSKLIYCLQGCSLEILLRPSFRWSACSSSIHERVILVHFNSSEDGVRYLMVTKGFNREKLDFTVYIKADAKIGRLLYRIPKDP